MEGLIDSELDEPTHCTINFLAGNTLARAYVLKGTNNSPLAFKEGDFVRMKCVYSPQFDKNGNLSDLSLWVNNPADLQVIDSLKTDARFNIPVTFSKDIQSDTSTGCPGSGRGCRAQLRARQMGHPLGCHGTNHGSEQTKPAVAVRGSG